MTMDRRSRGDGRAARWWERSVEDLLMGSWPPGANLCCNLDVTLHNSGCISSQRDLDRRANSQMSEAHMNFLEPK